MKESIVIGILAKNCSQALKKNIQLVEDLGSRFSDYYVVILENNSVDGTKKVISSWAARNKKVISVTRDNMIERTSPKGLNIRFPGVSPFRIGRIAQCRNILLNEIRSRFCPDFVCMIDADLYGFDVDGIVDSIHNAPQGWGALFANGQNLCLGKLDKTKTFPSQYDCYAYLPEGADYRDSSYCVYKRKEQDRLCYEMNKLLESNNSDYLKITSAFGGIGVYKFESIRELSYEAIMLPQLAPLSVCLCEHVPFNSAVAAQGYGLYIARRMHSYRKSYSPFQTANAFIRQRKALGFWPEF